jgi:hypothetical protein
VTARKQLDNQRILIELLVNPGLSAFSTVMAAPMMSCVSSS